MVFLTLPVVVAVVSLCAASPQSIHTVDFPDPSITFDPQTSHWFTFATHSNEKNVQAATSPTLHGKWSLLTDFDLLPVPGQWVNPTQPDIWAPDVITSSTPTRMFCTTRACMPTVLTTVSASPRRPTSKAHTARWTSLSLAPSQMAERSTQQVSMMSPATLGGSSTISTAALRA